MESEPAPHVPPGLWRPTTPSVGAPTKSPRWERPRRGAEDGYRSMLSPLLGCGALGVFGPLEDLEELRLRFGIEVAGRLGLTQDLQEHGVVE